MFMTFLIILVACIICVILYFKWAFKYWERKNVPYIQPAIPFGTMDNPLRAKYSFGEIIKKHYEESKQKGYDHVGLFTFSSPTYMPIKTEYIKCILLEDFNYFVDRGVYFNEKDDPISASLFSLSGSRWKNLRTKLTPTFTSGKLKMMFSILLECGTQLTKAVEENCVAQQPIDIKDLLARFSTDVISACAFGIDGNSFKDPNSEFRKYTKRAILQTKWESLQAFLAFANPTLGHLLGICPTPKEVSTFFFKIIKDTIDYRVKNNIIRNDFLQLLLNLMNTIEKESLSIVEITSQAFVFFLAGFETSSTAMTFCLFELAQNQHIQQKVRNEINTVLNAHKGEVTYDAVKEMKYLMQVINEVLRKYPPVPILNRKCVMDYKLPNTNVTVEKGTGVVIPLYGLHYDPNYFPNPENFDPERFSEKNKAFIKPFTYMPFGEGPRFCIGLRFGLMLTAVGLSLLIKKFRFSLSKKTKLPLRMSPFSFTLSALGDIWLNVDEVLY